LDNYISNGARSSIGRRQSAAESFKKTRKEPRSRREIARIQTTSAERRPENALSSVELKMALFELKRRSHWKTVEKRIFWP
jgi:hypothetical protein